MGAEAAASTLAFGRVSPVHTSGQGLSCAGEDFDCTAVQQDTQGEGLACGRGWEMCRNTSIYIRQDRFSCQSGEQRQLQDEPQAIRLNSTA